MIQNISIEFNPYVKIYMQAGEIWRETPSREVNIVLKDNHSFDKTYNKPTSDEIAVLMVDDDQTTLNQRDVVVTKRIIENQFHFQNLSSSSSQQQQTPKRKTRHISFV